MNSPKLSPETTQRLLGNLIKSNYSLKLWLGIAWVGFLILPWYAAYDGFWSFIWITEGYPTFDEYSPGILQITMHQRWWLWPIALALLVPLPALFYQEQILVMRPACCLAEDLVLSTCLHRASSSVCTAGVGFSLETSLVQLPIHKWD